jgi:GT2 family glycosyltransferase
MTYKKKGLIFKALRFYRRYGLRNFMRHLVRRTLKVEQDYPKWLAQHLPDEDALEKQRKTAFALNPLVSIVVPLYRTSEVHLREMVESVLAQTYGHFELCLADGSGGESQIRGLLEDYEKKDGRIRVKVLADNLGISGNTNEAVRMATGDFVAFLDHDDFLPPHALFEVVSLVNGHPDAEVIYSDEDKVDMEGKRHFSPHFKPDFNLDLLRSTNYISHFLVFRKDIVDRVGEFRRDFDGAQDYDFILRAVEEARHIHHIPRVLYHWRSHEASSADNPENKLYAFEAGKRALDAHYARQGIPATVSDGVSHGIYHAHYDWGEEPLISIVVPNKDHIDDLANCIDAIEKRSTYRNFEWVIVENNSEKEETFEYYRKLEGANPRVQVVRYEGEFNYSAINNYGVGFTKGEYILFLNNDTEIINADCLSELLGYCLREDVGIVGAKLYYPDDTIQHAGVVVGMGGVAGHTFVGLPRYEYGYFSRENCAQDYSAVTAACMMTKKTLFQAVGGFSDDFRIAFNDIDYCLKVREKGKLVVYNPYAELYHFESKSRGQEDTPEKVERFNSEIDRFTKKWKEFLRKGDPYYNVNLTLDRADFSLKKHIRTQTS